MSPRVKPSVLCLAGLAAACGGGSGISSPNAAPAAAFGSACADLACSFSDSSTDADGQIAAYRWSFGDGSPDATTRDAEHTYAASGTYSVSLAVTDDRGATDSVAGVAHAAVRPNASPVASFGSSCVDLTCTFSDASTDADGRIAGYRWSFGDASADETARVTEHTYAAPGSYSVALTVTDDRGATAGVVHLVQAVAPNVAPDAAFSSSCVDLTCTFSDLSSDPDGTIVSRHWAFGDGEGVDGPAPAHSYPSSGVYHVELAVTDDRGATTVVAHDITTTEAGGPAIAVSDSILSYCYHPGATRICIVLSRDIRITSVGGKALNWTASSDQPWIVISLASGRTPSTVKVSIDLAKLRPISFGSTLGARGSITVSAAGAANSPRRIPVTVYFYAVRLPR